MQLEQKVPLSNSQWERIEEKYKGLMILIAKKISGDNAICSLKDNLQDISIAAMDAVKGYEKQNGGANGKFDEFFETKGFDKYIKSCMWRCKAKKGALVTKKRNITSSTVSLSENPEIFENTLTCSGKMQEDSNEIIKTFSSLQKSIISLILSDPTYLKGNGKVNVLAISKELGLTWLQTFREISSIHTRLADRL